jgi:type IV secretory pathway VirB10-like protein
MNDPKAPILDTPPAPPPLPAGVAAAKPAHKGRKAGSVTGEPTQPRPSDTAARRKWKEERARALGDLPRK